MPRRYLLGTLVNIAMVAIKNLLPFIKFANDLLFIAVGARLFAEYHWFSHIKHLMPWQIAPATSTDKLTNLELEDFGLRIIIKLFEGARMSDSIFYQDLHPTLVAI